MKHVLGSGLSRGLAVILCFLLLVDQGLCWGAGGHMIVAQIAYARLNSRAKAEVDKLIGLRIEPAAITEKSLDFVNASHWPDDLSLSDIESRFVCQAYGKRGAEAAFPPFRRAAI